MCKLDNGGSQHSGPKFGQKRPVTGKAGNGEKESGKGRKATGSAKFTIFEYGNRTWLKMGTRSSGERRGPSDGGREGARYSHR